MAGNFPLGQWLLLGCVTLNGIIAGCGGVGSTTQPTVTVSVSPATITLGSSATLTWSSTNPTSCTPSGDWSGRSRGPGLANTGSATRCQHCISYLVTEVGWHISRALGVYRTNPSKSCVAPHFRHPRCADQLPALPTFIGKQFPGSRQSDRSLSPDSGC